MGISDDVSVIVRLKIAEGLPGGSHRSSIAIEAYLGKEDAEEAISDLVERDRWAVA